MLGVWGMTGVGNGGVTCMGLSLRAVLHRAFRLPRESTTMRELTEGEQGGVGDQREGGACVISSAPATSAGSDP